MSLPLHVAAYEGHSNVVKLLLEKGARLWDPLKIEVQHGSYACDGCDEDPI